MCFSTPRPQSIITQPLRRHRLYSLRSPLTPVVQAQVAVDRAEVLEPGCSSLNPGPDPGLGQENGKNAGVH